MRFYLIHMETPDIIHAHRYQTPRYEMVLPRQPDHFEIAAIEQGRILRKDGFVYEEGGIALLSRTEELSLFSDAELHCHCTFAFRTGKPPVLLTAEEVTRWKPQDGMLLLPEYLPPGKAAGEAQKLIRQIVSARTSADHNHFLVMRAAMYQLFALLTGAAVSLAAEAEGSELQNHIYCRRAVEYIHGHIHEKISASDTAAYAGVSYGYLSRIFRASMGMTLVEYANRAKIQRVRELIASRNIPLTDAGLIVGIDDVKYLSRLFKKYSGITCAEYRSIQQAKADGQVTPPGRKEDLSC